MEKYDNIGQIGEGSYGMVMKCRHKVRRWEARWGLACSDDKVITFGQPKRVVIVREKVCSN